MNIIIHPPFFKFFPSLLRSLKGNEAQLIHVLSSSTNKKQELELRKIIKENYTGNNLCLHIDKKPYTIAKARTFLAKQSIADWIVCFDADIVLVKDYFKHLSRILSTIDSKTVAIAGGIDINLFTPYGIWEGLADMRVYYRGVLGAYTTVQGDLVGLRNQLHSLSGCETKYFQGFNHIIKRSYLEEINYYDVDFWSAEDRELACRIRSKNQSIKLFPELMVYHNYNFSLKDIIRRKRIHGYWYTRLRNKYPSEELVPQLSSKLLCIFFSQLLFGLKSFRGFYGGLYIRISIFSYLYGILESKLGSFKFRNGWKYGD
ncbi:MAG: glycosyltransferase [bacterium]